MKESMDPWIKSLALSSSSEWLLISQGAEARVWKIPVPASSSNDKSEDSSTLPPQPSFIICKERFPKKYRHPILDERLIKARVRAEVKALEKCWTAALTTKDESLVSSLLRVPKVLRVDAPLIYLEYLQGQSVRAYLEDLLESPETTITSQEEEDSTTTTTTKQQLLQELAKTMGKTVATLHSLGIIHGDLTTSNMMLLPGKDGDKEANATTIPSSFSLALIDFGLAKNGTISVEERAVDLYVLERALEATHPQVGDDFSVTLLDAYGQHMNHQNTTTSAANNNNKNKASKSKDASVSNNKNTKQYNSGDAILQRLDKVRQRGRKRECFG